METSLAESQTDSYFLRKWPNGYPKQNDVSDTHIQKRTLTKINHKALLLLWYFLLLFCSFYFLYYLCNWINFQFSWVTVPTFLEKGLSTLFAVFDFVVAVTSKV